MKLLRGMSSQELIAWAEENLHVYLSVNAEDSALLGHLSRLGVVL